MDDKLIISVIISSFFLVYLLLKFLNKQWFAPIRFQRRMRAQGIRGPPYRFIHGNAKEINDMKIKSMSKPMEAISHDIYARISPQKYIWSKIYGGTYLQWFGTQAELNVMDSVMIREIMNDKEGAYPKPRIMSLTRELHGDGLITTIERKKWSKLRKVANHTFNGDSLKSMIPEMVASADMLVQKWRDYIGKEIEVFEEFRVYTSDVISRTAFGSSYLEGKKIFEMLVELVTLATRTSLMVKIPVISWLAGDEDQKRMLKLKQGIRNSVIKMIKDREDKFEKHDAEGYGNDFLGTLVKCYNDPDHTQRMSLDEVIDECRTFYIAGQESTTTLLSWVTFLLAIHQDWQEEARREVISTFGQENPDNDGLGKLKIMSMILNETQRLYPVIPGQLRSTAKEVKLGSLVIPADTNLFIPMLAMHHDPHIWGKDVLDFKPERFSEGIAKATNNNIAAFTPFGLGPRICAGINFATNETKIGLCMILQRYRFTLSSSYVHSPVMGITIKPQHGVQVILQSV